MRVALALVCITTFPGIVLAESKVSEAPDEDLFRCRKPKGPIKIEFTPELELNELVRWASAFSCESLIVSSQLATRKLKVSIIVPKKMSTRSAWSLFQIALRAMNVALVKKGGIYVVLESPQAKGHALPLIGKKSQARGLARTLVSAEHLSGDELASVVGALKSKDGEVTTLAGTDVVLVTDYIDHIGKMRELLDEVDRSHAEHEGVYVVPVAHADVSELASTIEAIVGRGGTAQPAGTRAVAKGRGKSSGKNVAPASGRATSSGPRSIIADPRTRSIILVASKSEFARTRSLIKRLDVATDEQSSQIHMIGLEHADAEELATTLNALLGGRSPADKEKGTSKRPAPVVTGAIAVDGAVRVTHDGPTNSLLVSSTMRDFLGLREIIRRLDSTRPQVYIEAMIMEVSVSGERTLGGSFHLGGTTKGGGTWLAGLQQSDLQSTSIGSLVGAAGLLGGLFGAPISGFDVLGQSIPSFGALFQALATSRRAHLISSPRIMTSDNTAATLKVGEKRRELGGTSTGPGGVTTQNPETVSATLSLKVTPHVNATDEVKLEIELLLEEFLPSRSESLGSDTSSREITNTVVVRDQESIIIGGLIVEREVDTESKVPLLGDFPFLGYLFKSKTKDREKRNLVVLLTPYVLDSRADHNHIVRKTLAERGEFMQTHMRLKGATPTANIDYRKKRGLLEVINQRAKAIEIEKVEYDRAKASERSEERPEGPF